MGKLFTQSELLRFTTAGSVDDGKSTLIGRLLYDSKSIFEDQLASLERSTQRRGREGVDLSLLTDGLEAEREQGITIDVAYRYFSTGKRKFIIADTPGHEQYTRNMVTGASTADLALILVDAKKGLQPQSRRHAYISSLLGLNHIFVCVNKMDLVGFDKKRFAEIEQEFRNFVKDIDIPDLRFFPIAALQGDNVVKASTQMTWFSGQTLLTALEEVEVIKDQDIEGFRFPVQYVNRPDAQFRGYCGTVLNGLVKKGDDVIILPSGVKTKIAGIVTSAGLLVEAFSPMAVTLTLTDDADVSRGDMIVAAGNLPWQNTEHVATVCWMDAQPLTAKKKYLVKSSHRLVKAVVTGVDNRLNINNLNKEKASALKLNEIGEIHFKSLKPLFTDPYVESRSTGSFIFIDETSHNTVAAGMIV